MIDVEAHIDRAIVYFFAPDEYRLFIDTVLDRLTFATKIGALRRMLRMVGIEEKHKGFLNELDALRAERNKFAYAGFDLVGNSYLTEGADFELHRKERLDPGPRVEDIVHLSELQALARRAKGADERALAVERELTEAHATPTDYFHREGWDPRGRFTPYHRTPPPTRAMRYGLGALPLIES